ncbi:hypothetical protein SAY86_013909 [Trapa natans]|uniref:J domain-containing protein n=1 Tax=Trapa natans TaxID=22666 RepID=A0AAN7KT63_TRANT|nr:hypothetical protein SAY86_013909 [Trapa natans]
MLSISSPPTTPCCLTAAARPLRHLRPSQPLAAFTSSSETPSKFHASAPLQASDMAAARASFYDVLGIQVGATSQEIKTAYRRLARACHPDVADAVRPTTTKDAAGHEFMRIHAAYSTLSDPQKRAAYDGKLYCWRARPLTAVTSGGGSGLRGRSWETDQCW